MVALQFLNYAKDWCLGNYLGVEDFADKANFLWNVVILIICMSIVTAREYFMSPIVCFVPTSFGGVNAVGYLTSLCWVEGVYPYNISKPVPSRKEDWEALRPTLMNYYQWVPFVLALQAILYYLPRLLWQLFTHSHAGADLQNMVVSASNAAKGTGQPRERCVNNIVANLEELLFDRRLFRTGKNARFHNWIRWLPGKRQGNNVLAAYMFIKVLYVIVGFCQLVLMYRFLRMDRLENYQMFGYRILVDIMAGKTWQQTEVFPRVGVCRQELKHLGADNIIFGQCVLPINMLNEKIYIFLFFFLSIILLLTIASIPLWIYRTAFLSRQVHFIRRFLKMSGCINENKSLTEKVLINNFVEEFLRQDGQFILRIISMNAGDIIATDIVTRLYEVYKKKYTESDFRKPDKAEQFLSFKIEDSGLALKQRRMQEPSAPEGSSYSLESKKYGIEV